MGKCPKCGIELSPTVLAIHVSKCEIKRVDEKEELIKEAKILGITGIQPTTGIDKLKAKIKAFKGESD